MPFGKKSQLPVPVSVGIGIARTAVEEPAGSLMLREADLVRSLFDVAGEAIACA